MDIWSLLKLVLTCRTGLVCWVVSHCNTISKRERYVKELKKYIEVDIYGNCGQKCGKRNTDECFQQLSSFPKLKHPQTKPFAVLQDVVKNLLIVAKFEFMEYISEKKKCFFGFE